MASKHAEFNLCHVDPRAMLGRVVELQASGNPSGFGRLEGLAERGDVVGVEVVQHHANHLSMRIGLVHQPLHLVSEIYRCASFGHLQVLPTPQRLKEHEQVPRSVALVLIVKTLTVAGL